MKTLFPLLILNVTALAAADLSGQWKLEGDVANVHINRICTLKQSGNKLTGKCKNQTNEVTLTGDVDGKDVKWKYDADYENIKVSLVFTGKVEPDSLIKGTIETQGTSGRFTAARQ